MAGNVFAGTVDWKSCQPWREHPMSMKITGVVTSKVYPARLGVTAHVAGDIPHEQVTDPNIQLYCCCCCYCYYYDTTSV